MIEMSLRHLTEWNVEILRAWPGRYPPLYSAGVRYQAEPPRRGRPEQWLTIPDLYAQRHGDCEDLACARAAQLQVQGVRAKAKLLQLPDGLWHVVVEMPDGRTEDPSARLGMPSDAPEREGMAPPPSLARRPPPPSPLRAPSGPLAGPAGAPAVSGRFGRRLARGLRRADEVLRLRRLARGGVQLASQTLLGRAGRTAATAAFGLARAASAARRAADDLERNPTPAAERRAAAAAEHVLDEADRVIALKSADAGALWA